MCSFEEDDPDFRDTETQIFDSQFSPPSLHGVECKDDSADKLQFLQSTAPFHDTIPLEDVETQEVNLAGETQEVNLAGETQEVDLCGEALVFNVGAETQAGDNVEDICTQLFDDCDTEVVDTDGERTEITDVLGDTEEFSDVDSVKKACSDPVDQEKVLLNVPSKQGKSESKATLSNEECSTGSVHRRFTSIRAASIRASGLAARNRFLERTKSCSMMSDSQLLMQHDTGDNEMPIIRDISKVVEQTDQEYSLKECDYQMKGSRNNKCRTGRSAVRKLFTEDAFSEKGLNDNINSANKEADFPLFSSENGVAGLSYVDSQEPGEASQANALDFVDRFLKVNVTEFNEEIDVKKSTGGKSKPVSGAKGTQIFAKSANHICSIGGSEIFDWDDNREDDGGGEFFRRKKEAFFDNESNGQKRFSQPRHLKTSDSKRCRTFKGNSDKEEQLGIHEKVMGLVYSDSKLLLHKPKGTEELTKLKGRKNLIEELDKESDIGRINGMIEIGTENDNLDMLNVGFDTQLAAEAMEALCSGVGATVHDSDDAKKGAEAFQNGSAKGKKEKGSNSKKTFVRKRTSYTSSSGVITRQSKQTKKVAPKLRTEGKTLNKRDIDKIDRCQATASVGQRAAMHEQLYTCTPIACRTRKCTGANQSKMNNMTVVEPKRKWSRTESNGFAREKCTKTGTNLPGELKNANLTHGLESDPMLSGDSAVKNDANHHPRIGSYQRLPPFQQGANGESNAKFKMSEIDASLTCEGQGLKRKTRSSVVASPVLPSMDRQSGKRLLRRSSLTRSDAIATVNRNPIDLNCSGISKNVSRPSEHLIGKSDEDILPFPKEAVPKSRLEESRKDTCASSASVCKTPFHCPKLVNEASPICMGDEYHKQSCRKRLSRSSLEKEISSLITTGLEPTSTLKGLRKRRDVAKVQVLFSHHLDGDIIKQQKKVLARLGASVASSISDATHFIADEFVRTRNMLEAIAFGKPVVTHLWLESCGQASCLIDERNYILRDVKKEKEFGFSLPVSLARASQYPLLQGQKVLITPNTKPGIEILASLVKAVNGVAVERIGRSALKDDNIPEDVLVLSCEEDYSDCVTFLEKGAAVYSSELLLNGIVTQKLEYERHRLFADNVKKTRSTIWLRKGSNQYIPVTKCK